jgi:triose/dihydroxyacetone kinase / FAD-AMP lyase (cyclizing)
MDTIMGDGDCGTTLTRGSGTIVTALDAGVINTGSLSHGMMSIADVIARSMGGTSGALYAVFFTALASALCSDPMAKTEIRNRERWAAALTAGLQKLEQVTAARQGDRTMMDALIPFVHAFADENNYTMMDAIERSAAASKVGCDNTKSIESKFGRSTYVTAESAASATDGIPDPGACGVVAIVNGILDSLKEQDRKKET